MYVCFYYVVLVCPFFVCSGVKTDTKRRCPTRQNRREKNRTQRLTPSERRKTETTTYTEKEEKKRRKTTNDETSYLSTRSRARVLCRREAIREELFVTCPFLSIRIRFHCSLFFLFLLSTFC